jgi:hypothetical protein
MRGEGRQGALSELYKADIWIGNIVNCHSGEKSPFRDDDSRSAGQEYPSLYGTRKIHYNFHTHTPLQPTPITIFICIHHCNLLPLPFSYAHTTATYSHYQFHTHTPLQPTPGRISPGSTSIPCPSSPLQYHPPIYNHICQVVSSLHVLQHPHH